MNNFTPTQDDAIKVVEAMNRNNFNAKYLENKEEAIKEILSLIPDNSSKIGVGGSVTIAQLGLLELLEKSTHEILDHGKAGLSPEEALEIRRLQLTCDVFLTGTNAVTLDGKLVNTDGIGNRVASMIFGPKRVIIIVGINKIVNNIDEAITRIENIAAPLNNKRLNRPNPCVKTGKCMNCNGPTRICNVTTILSKRPGLTDIHVFIVGEELGY